MRVVCSQGRGLGPFQLQNLVLRQVPSFAFQTWTFGPGWSLYEGKKRGVSCCLPACAALSVPSCVQGLVGALQGGVVGAGPGAGSWQPACVHRRPLLQLMTTCCVSGCAQPSSCLQKERCFQLLTKAIICEVLCLEDRNLGSGGNRLGLSPSSTLSSMTLDKCFSLSELQFLVCKMETLRILISEAWNSSR